MKRIINSNNNKDKDKDKKKKNNNSKNKINKEEHLISIFKIPWKCLFPLKKLLKVEKEFQEIWHKIQ